MTCIIIRVVQYEDSCKTCRSRDGLSRQKRYWQLLLWSGLYNITVEILRTLTIKLTRARPMAMAMAMARTRARALARTRDRPRLRAKGLGLGLESVFTFKRPDRFCRRTKFNVTG